MQMEKVGWGAFAASLVVLWLVRIAALRGSLKTPYAGICIVCLAVVASLIIVYMVMRSRMTLVRFLAFIFLQFYIMLIYGLLYARFGLVDGEGRILRDAASGFYFSLVTWTTLGYGDLSPPAPIRLFAASEAVLGYISMGVLIALILHWLRGSRDKT